MPPKRKAAAAATDPLAGVKICISGTLSQGKKQVEDEIKANGGGVCAAVTKACTHLVTTDADFAAATAKVSAAQASGIPIVTEDWLRDSISGGSLADTASYEVGAKTAKAAPVAVAVPAAKKGKAPAMAAAAAAPAASSSSSSETIPVDKDCRAVGAGAAVYQDYAYLANQVNIAGGNNNNKFYRGQVLVSGGSFYSWTRWGRVGEVGQSNLDGPTGADAAVAAFSKKFKDKTSHKWAGRTADYPGGKTGKYTVIFENFSGEQKAALAAAEAASGGPVTFAPAKIKGSLADFTALITDADMFKSQLATLGVDTAKMPLGDISQRTVDAGFKALLDIETYLKAGGGPRLAELCGAFYTYIPHNFGRSKAPLLSLGDIENKKAMLNVIGDVGAAVSAESGAKAKKGKAESIPAPIDSKYESLGCELKPVDKKSATFKMIEAYTDNTQGYRKCKVDEVFELERDDQFGSHAKKENRKLLWHGTNVAVVAAILKSGLRIMPHSGGRVGSGIYLASENGKSAGYVTAQGHKGVMFLCEAVLGKQRFVTRDGMVGWNEKDPVSKHGADSVLAVGSTEPDAAADVTVKLDGKDVVVPQGIVKPNPILKDHGGSSSYSQSEYLIYNESQVRIRYVIQMKFQTAGGHWH